MKKSALNLPNTLSLLRAVLTPVFVIVLVLMRDVSVWGKFVPAVIFAIASATDFLDGHIARSRHLVTDFGKFIDPLADKFLVIGSLIAMNVLMAIEGENVEATVFLFVVLLILLRELGVTSLRLVVAGKEGIVVAASIFGKAKTVSQIVGTLVILLEPIVFPFSAGNHVMAYVFMGIMTFTTVFSGMDYLKTYLPYIDSNS